MAEYDYRVTVAWTGDRGSGTSGWRDYGRQSLVAAEGRPPIEASADRVFHGDAERWNPELLLLAALSQCHMLSYLRQAALAGVLVVGYRDEAAGRIAVQADGSGRFVGATLHPQVTLAEGSMLPAARRLHEPAARQCFIAASVDFPVHREPSFRVRE
ncbi:MAG TPA: OsmC family protein [Microbacteriaceae bacterium]|nr:OsmC family protein [Microbacteriaceae bacterium]